MKAIVMTVIETKLPRAEVQKIAEERAPHFKKVNGLIRKFWIYNSKENSYRGIFEFENLESAEKYLKTPFAKSVGTAYQTIKPVKVEILEVLKEEKFN